MVDRRPIKIIGLALLGLVLTACGTKKVGDSAAIRHASRAEGIVTEMSEALAARDVENLTSLWVEGAQAGARQRAETGFGHAGRVDLTLMVTGIRAQGDEVDVRVAWHGIWGGEAVSGNFEMGVTTGEPARILWLNGSDPAAGPRAAETPKPPRQ